MKRFDPIRKGAAVALVAAIVILARPGGSPLRAADVEFGSAIRPILSENCFHCHGPDAAERKAKLRLDQRDEATDWEELVRRIASSDPDEVMPPPDSGKKLSAEEVATLQEWIAEGAGYDAHWSFLPIRKYDPPAMDDPKLTEIDRFIVAALNKRGLSLSKPVSRLQLIRRATFDLTGLPPKWSDVEAFAVDSSRTRLRRRSIDYWIHRSTANAGGGIGWTLPGMPTRTEAARSGSRVSPFPTRIGTM